MSAEPPADPDRARDEQRLVGALLAGDREAVREFLARTHHPVWCLAARVTRDPDERRDWAHDALLGILDDLARGRFEYRRPGSFWAWFRTRVYFRLLDARRRARTREQREAVPADDTPDLTAFGVTHDPHEELERVRIAAAVEDCLERLEHPEQRRALRLLLGQELPYQEIADALAAPLNSVRVWILRARIALRRCLAARWGILPAAEEGDA